MTCSPSTRPPGLNWFSTRRVPESHRIRRWEEHNARSLVGLQARTLGGVPFDAGELNLDLPRVQLARVSGTPHVVHRDARQIAAHPADGVVAYFTLAGQGCFSHRHGREVLEPGQGIVCDGDQPFVRGFSRGLTELVVKVPRHAAREVCGRSGVARPQVFAFRGERDRVAHARALVSAVTTALDGSVDGTAVDWESLESTVLALMSALLGVEDGAEARLAAARAHITAHLHDPDLSASTIAAAVGYSDRHLSRLFAESGSSIPQAILAARLGAVRRALADPANAGTSLSELAARHGFASPAHFSRTYRARFGVTPLRDRTELLARE